MLLIYSKESERFINESKIKNLKVLYFLVGGKDKEDLL